MDISNTRIFIITSTYIIPINISNSNISIVTNNYIICNKSVISIINSIYTISSIFIIYKNSIIKILLIKFYYL